MFKLLPCSPARFTTLKVATSLESSEESEEFDEVFSIEITSPPRSPSASECHAPGIDSPVANGETQNDPHHFSEQSTPTPERALPGATHLEEGSNHEANALETECDHKVVSRNLLPPLSSAAADCSRSPKDNHRRGFSPSAWVERLSPLLGRARRARSAERHRPHAKPDASLDHGRLAEPSDHPLVNSVPSWMDVLRGADNPNPCSPIDTFCQHAPVSKAYTVPIMPSIKPTISIHSPPLSRNSETLFLPEGDSSSNRLLVIGVEQPLSRLRSASAGALSAAGIGERRSKRRDDRHEAPTGTWLASVTSQEKNENLSNGSSSVEDPRSDSAVSGNVAILLSDVSRRNTLRTDHSDKSPFERCRSRSMNDIASRSKRREVNHLSKMVLEQKMNGKDDGSSTISESSPSPMLPTKDEFENVKDCEKHTPIHRSFTDSASRPRSVSPFRRSRRISKKIARDGSIRSNRHGDPITNGHEALPPDDGQGSEETDTFDATKFQRLPGESDEDALTRLQALRTRSASRRGSTVVHIPNAEIRMDLHTLYVANLNVDQPRGRGRTFMDEASSLGRKIRRMSSDASLDGDAENEKKPMWQNLLQIFQKRESNGTMEEFRDCLAHLRSNLVEETQHELTVYVDSHWSQLPAANGFNEQQMQSFNTQDLDALDPNERKRFEALWELFYAEVVYLIDHLLVLQNVFAKPLQHIRTFGYLPNVDQKILFVNLEKLIEVTAKFAKRLLFIFKGPIPTVTKSTGVIVKAFTDFDRVVKPEYFEYCLNYQRAVSAIDGFKNDEEFQEFLRWCESDARCKRLHLNDLLVSPLQHLTKYPLLLKAIRNKTQKNDKNYYLLTATIVRIERSIKMIERRVSLVTNLERIQEIQDSLVWPSLTESDQKVYIPEFLKSILSTQPCERVLINPARVLHHEGFLTLFDGAKLDVYAFLFDDMLLVTKYKGKFVKRRNTSPPDPLATDSPRAQKKLAGDQSAVQYVVYKQPVPLDRFTVYDCEEYQNAAGTLKNGFVVVQKNRYSQVFSCFTFQANSSEEKSKWVKTLKKLQVDFLAGIDPTSDEEYLI